MSEPYLSIDEHDHHGRPSTLHAHEHDDPDHTSESGSNRLNDFASHILDSRAPAPHPHILSFTGEGGVLESSEHHAFDVEDVVRRAMEDHERERERQREGDQGDFQPHIEDAVGASGHESPAHEMAIGGRKNTWRGRKRKAGDVGEDGEPLDAASVKRENHKEVERKRRTNINEGIDQLVAQMGFPELEKAGKGVQLRRAVEYMAELGDRVMVADKEVEDLRKEKQDLEANLALTSQRYTEEHERCTRYETMWRDAQDREAKSQFEIAQLLDEIAQLRRRVGESDA